MEFDRLRESDKQIFRCSRFKNLILDVGNVLLHQNLEMTYGTVVSPHRFKRMLRNSVWFSYQSGKLSRDEAFDQLSKQMGCSAQELREFYHRARDSSVPIKEIVDVIERLELKLFCMTNCPAEDLQTLQDALPDLFGRFEKIFTSSAAGMRKPNLNFFKHVLAETDIKPSETVFLDDDLTNVTAAESLGITSILVPSPYNAPAMAQTVRAFVSTLRNKQEQLSAARDYMLATRGFNKSLALTHAGVRVPTNFDHFIIAELLDDAIYLPMQVPPVGGTINFFPQSECSDKNGYTSDRMAFTHINFPDDADTTSIGLSALYKFSKVKMSVLNTVLDRMEKDLISEDGLFLVYFDSARPRLDPVTMINTLYLFHLAGRGGRVTEATEEFIRNLPEHRGYTRGTIYYRAPEAFLLQLAKLIFGFKAHFQKAGFVKLLRARVSERICMHGDALTLAMRVLACVMCGMHDRCNGDLEHLCRLQNVNGSWDVCPFYSNNSPNTWFGNEAVTTAFAIAAIEAHQRVSLSVQPKLRNIMIS